MSALPYPTYGLSNLYLFPVYQTREAYRAATGVEAPPYDQNKPVKSWFDPNPPPANIRRKVTYERVVAYADNGAPLATPDGYPVLEPLVIDRDMALVVNIPVKRQDLPDQPTTGLEIPVPLRAVEPGEELFFQFGGSVAVKNKDVFADIEVGFKSHDRALLRAIAGKLGVSV